MNGKKIMTVLGIILISGLGYFKGMGIYSGTKVPQLGLVNNTLQICGEKPNCVSTSNSDEKHKIAPIQSSLDFSTVINTFKESGFEVVSSNENYAHFTFSSKFMSYVDDIEILSEGSLIYIRSASRVGYSDMGANRKRVEVLRTKLTQTSN